jgi:ubiquinone/menaquinone biosynthesis C-methylase UbiE
MVCQKYLIPFEEDNMPSAELPETIENQWNIFYRDYPEIYDRFGKVMKQPTAVQEINRHFPLAGLNILDVGSGTGLSTFELAQYAQSVVGIEPEAAMRTIAEQEASRLGITNVRFLEGWAEALPIPGRSVDMVAAITLASLGSEGGITGFAREAERVVKPGGVVLTVNIASRWYGGELSEVILGLPRDRMELDLLDKLFPELGYSLIEFFASQDYGTVENCVQTYGFIFGKKAIDHIRAHHITNITWKINIHYKRVS